MESGVYKTCTKCYLEKFKEDYAIKNKKTSEREEKRHTSCKDCQKLYNRDHYKENIQYYNEKRLKWNQARAKDYTNYKESLNCKKCNISFKGQAYLCDFHHRDGETKEYEPSKMRYYSMEKIMKEVSKCDPLCANCHRHEHNKKPTVIINDLHLMVMSVTNNN